jgi:hypothetical protein
MLTHLPLISRDPKDESGNLQRGLLFIFRLAEMELRLNTRILKAT